MNKKIHIFSLTTFLAFGLVARTPLTANASIAVKGVVDTNGCSVGKLPTSLNLSPCSEEEIREYYSSLNTLEEGQRKGIDVLQYIKPILYEMNYFSYSQVGDIYSITDRDWANSPTLYSGVYDSVTQTVTDFSTTIEANFNPYIKMLYVDYSNGVKTPLKNVDNNANFDKEHVWCQSRGFKAPSGAQGPAGTDLHHLIAGDSYVNQQIHNNNPYGFVDSISKTGNLSYTGANKRGTIKHTSTFDQATTVFEPANEWKGDIARAIFYMMARYNNISGKDTISKYEPNLEIVNYATSNAAGEESSATKAVGMGILSDLLAWNKLDPVDEFEIYRNDLIYRNFQGNRNPFIDFPDWIDAIWGTSNLDGTNYSSTPVGVIDPLKDNLHGTKDPTLNVSTVGFELKIDKTNTIIATTSDGSDITWSVENNSIVSISDTTSSSGESITVVALSGGETKITVTATIDGNTLTKEISIRVKEDPHTIENPDVEEEPQKNPIDPLIFVGIVVFILILIFCPSIIIKAKKMKRKYSSKKKSTSKKRTKK